jgi:hypothetical protein
MQLSIELIPYENTPTFGKVTKTIIPVVWMQEGAEARPKHLFILQIIASLQNGWDLLRFGFVGIGAVCLIIAAGIVFSRKPTQTDTVVLVK